MDACKDNGYRGVQHRTQSGENVIFHIAGRRRKAFKTQNAECRDLGGQTQLTGYYRIIEIYK